MSAKQETTSRILLSALVICLVCSVLVAGAAVALKPKQIENRLLDTQRSILNVAGIDGRSLSAAEVQALFDGRISARLVDLQTGTFSDAHDPVTFNPLASTRDPSLSSALPGSQDIASIRRLERYSVVYLVEKDDGELETLVLPVRGYGLWSTLYGYIALEADLSTVVGLGFHEHAETPGLGGEIDNPRWKAQWPGKQLFNPAGDLAINVVKGSVNPQSSNASHQVDGLAGATLTQNGVNHLLHFWLGEQGFGQFIANLRAGRA